MRKRDCAFLTYLQTGYATATQRITFKNQRTAYFSLRGLTTYATEQQHLKGNWTKVHHICSHNNFLIDSVNATILVAIRPPVVE